MAVVLILILVSLGLAGIFLLGFLWAVRSGQFEDAQTPALRILTEDQAAPASRQAATSRPSGTHRV